MLKYSVILGLIFLVSCERYFMPDIEPQASSLVFEGFISDQYSAHFVKISRSYSYSEDSFFTGLGGFSVAIEDEFGRHIPMHDNGLGYYYSDSLKGSLETSYRMVALSPEGKTYHSAWEKLSPAARVDSIYGKYAVEKFLDYNDNIGYVEKDLPGITVLNDVQAKGFSPYYRYEYELVFQSTQYYPDMPAGLLIYVARPETSKYTDYVSVVNANRYAEQQITSNKVKFISSFSMLEGIPIDSIEYDEDGVALYEPDAIRITQRGLLIRLSQYSLSEKGFNFWDAIYKQTHTSGQIFDPIQSQIEGNITCAQDSSELVFGYFGASAVTKKAMYLNLRGGDNVQVEAAIYFPNLTKTIVSKTPFDFWIN